MKALQKRQTPLAGGASQEQSTEQTAPIVSLPALFGKPAGTHAFLSAEDQRKEILSRLSIRPHTSYELRRAGCYQCPTRVFELRAMGHQIETARVTVVDQDGFEHPRVALYTLVGVPGEVSA